MSDLRVLTIVIWLIGWPIACSVGRYLFAQARRIYKHEIPGQAEASVVSFFEFLVWLFVAVALTNL